VGALFQILHVAHHLGHGQHRAGLRGPDLHDALERCGDPRLQRLRDGLERAMRLVRVLQSLPPAARGDLTDGAVERLSIEHVDGCRDGGGSVVIGGPGTEEHAMSLPSWTHSVNDDRPPLRPDEDPATPRSCLRGTRVHCGASAGMVEASRPVQSERDGHVLLAQRTTRGVRARAALVPARRRALRARSIAPRGVLPPLVPGSVPGSVDFRQHGLPGVRQVAAGRVGPAAFRVG